MQSPVHFISAVCFGFLSMLLLTSCEVKDQNTSAPPSEAFKNEESKRQERLAKTTSFSGLITDQSGTPIADLSFKINETSIKTNSQGQFTLNNVHYSNYTVSINTEGSYIYHGVIKVNESTTNSDFAITLKNKSQDDLRLVLGGDAMFGRRFMVPEIKTMGTTVPEGDPDSLIRLATAKEDAIAVSKYMASFFQQADFSAVNLESPITLRPQTPHPTKEFNFFSVPDTLAGLTEIGVDYVSLGNNHQYDYQEIGLEDTLQSLDDVGLLHSGAGINAVDAYEIEKIQVKDTLISIFSANSISGEEHEIVYFATDSKGGAADLKNDERVKQAMENLVNTGDFSIAALHGGDEYIYKPTPYIKKRMELVCKFKPDLMISHHPHIAQGFAIIEGVPSLLGLGNFIFDQDRLETFMGILAVAEINKNAQKSVQRILAYPLYLEDYRPRFVTGKLADQLLRRITEFSGEGITVIEKQGYAEVYFEDIQTEKTVTTKEVNIQNDQVVLDLRHMAPTGSYLSNIEVLEGTQDIEVTLGRDTMLFGDFEDWDIDEETLEVARWDHSSDSVYPCVSQKYHGEQGMCSVRSQYTNTASVIPFRSTVRIMDYVDDNGNPQLFKNIALYGYAKGENAGDLKLDVTYMTERDSLEFRTDIFDVFAAGDYEWKPFYQAVDLPPEDQVLGPLNLPARGIRSTFVHFPPSKGEGLLALDDVAVISWEVDINIENSQWSTQKVHALDFINVKDKGFKKLKLTFTKHRATKD